jgi:phosphopantothenoylcysteine decarboxylase/phosphopantothenate--cysteine ligase
VLGADVTLVSGPVEEPDPPGVQVRRIETAQEMLNACQASLPVEIVICAAAVADWRVAEQAGQKLKKSAEGPPLLQLVENPDILATLSAPGPARPFLVVGFAAETEQVIAHAQAKRLRKKCDWILANDVSPATGTFGGAHNTIHLIREDGVCSWPTLSKEEVARRLAQAVANHLARRASVISPALAVAPADFISSTP